MTKQGSITTQMIFTKDRKQYSCYATPFGELTLGITTKQINITEEDNEISAELWYDLEVNGQHLSECELDIEVKECTTG